MIPKKNILIPILIIDTIITIVIILCVLYFYGDRISFISKWFNNKNVAQANTSILAGDTYFKLKDYDQSIFYYKLAMAKNPQAEVGSNIYKAYYFAGEESYNHFNFKKAIDYFSNSIAYNDDLYSSYYFRGRAYQSLGNLDSALKDFDKALQLNPELPSIYITRGMLNIQLNNYENAYQDLQKSIALLKNDQNSPLYKDTVKLLSNLKVLLDAQQNES